MIRHVCYLTTRFVTTVHPMVLAAHLQCTYCKTSMEIRTELSAQQTGDVREAVSNASIRYMRDHGWVCAECYHFLCWLFAPPSSPLEQQCLVPAFTQSLTKEET